MRRHSQDSCSSQFHLCLTKDFSNHIFLIPFGVGGFSSVPISRVDTRGVAQIEFSNSLITLLRHLKIIPQTSNPHTIHSSPITTISLRLKRKLSCFSLCQEHRILIPESNHPIRFSQSHICRNTSRRRNTPAHVPLLSKREPWIEKAGTTQIIRDPEILALIRLSLLLLRFQFQ